MTYILSLWLFVAGEFVGTTINLPATADCAATAAVIAEQASATDYGFSCVLEVEA